jgi:REP element-mobilizing transposase RayT
MAGPRNLIPIHAYRRVKIRSRGYLPHWEIEGATYFVTYRLHDSLPRWVVARLKQERCALERELADPGAVQKAFAMALDRELDSGSGASYLRDERLAAIVAENLRYFDGKRYALIAWCVMPNHVHVVLTPSSGEKLSQIVHSWKSYTAHCAMKILGVDRFWAREYYDHVIRSERELANTIAYVRNNPSKARLENWPWVG